MDFIFSFFAGTLSSLSPCVLPALPLVAGSAGNAHRLGLIAMAGGMITSFTILGVFFASLGEVIGIDQEIIRSISAAGLIVAGLILISKRLKEYIGNTFGRFTNNLVNRSASISSNYAGNRGLRGPFIIGFFLGAIWSPCVGPTLGIAISLAAKPHYFFASVTMLFLFGLGASLPLLIVGYAGKSIIKRHGRKLILITTYGNHALAYSIIFMGLVIITGFDGKITQSILAIMPDDWVKFVSLL